MADSGRYLGIGLLCLLISGCQGREAQAPGAQSATTEIPADEDHSEPLLRRVDEFYSGNELAVSSRRTGNSSWENVYMKDNEFSTRDGWKYMWVNATWKDPQQAVWQLCVTSVGSNWTPLQPGPSCREGIGNASLPVHEIRQTNGTNEATWLVDLYVMDSGLSQNVSVASEVAWNATVVRFIPVR